MRFRARLLRISAWSAAIFLGLFLALVIWIHAEGWIFRLRAERLIKDYQSIRLHQSSWAEAQNLMHRWGAWGYYDGQCNATNCKYVITLEDLASGFLTARGASS